MSKRRSSRLKAATTAVSRASTFAANDDSDTAMLSEEEFVQKPKRKKQKVRTFTGEGKQSAKPTTKKVRGKRGLLEQLTEMPIDVLLEIFGQLNPIDLIHLTRTTKQLRAILLNRSSIAIWRQALSNVSGLPPCLDEMSEPAYTHLMFESLCCKCLAKNTQTIFWDIGKRVCHRCVDQSEDFLPIRYSDVSNLAIENNSIHSTFPFMSFSAGSGRRRQNIMVADTVSVVSIKERYSNVAESERPAWLEKHMMKLKEQRARAARCAEWLDRRAELRASELENVREQRRDEIIKRLNDLGWSEEFEIMKRSHPINNHALVWQKKALTERIWNNIRDELIRFMQDTKTERIAEAEHQKLKVRQPLLKTFREIVYEPMKPVNSIIPPAVEFYAFEPFKRVMEDTPGTVQLTVDSLKEVIEGLDTFCEQWLLDRKHELLRMVSNGPVTKEDLENAETILRHPTTIFHCAECSDNGAMWYPRVLVHPHAFVTECINRKFYSESMMALFHNLFESPWNASNRISVKPEHKPRAEIVVELCGLDVPDAMVDALDGLDLILECQTCNSDNENKRNFMTWRSAIVHKCSRYRYNPIPEGTFPEFTLADEFIANIIRERRFENHLDGKEGTWYAGRRRYICVHCRTKHRHNAMKTHLASEHGKTTVSPEDFVYNIADDEDFFTYSYPVDPLNLRTIGMRRTQV